MKRVYHRYEKWEDFKNGMYDYVSGSKREEMLKKAIEFTGDHNLYGAAMMRVIEEWPISCENNLTDENHNRKAWVGHAACCLEKGIPEDITREAWGFLNDSQRDSANLEASKAISEWILRYLDKRGLRLQKEFSFL